MKKIMIIAPVVLLLVVFGAYTMFLKPKPVPPKKKIEGTVVPLQKEFLVNLAGGRYAKISVALVMEEAGGAAHGAAEGLPQEAAIRAIVTDELTGLPADELVRRDARHHVVERIAKGIKKNTDEHVGEVLLTDITIQ
ncbi:MAG: flagellar basal body-associated FliL family protein [Gaiellales bacterium]